MTLAELYVHFMRLMRVLSGPQGVLYMHHYARAVYPGVHRKAQAYMPEPGQNQGFIGQMYTMYTLSLKSHRK